MEIRFEVVDSTSDPETAARLAGELYEKGNVAVIAGVSSSEAIAMVAKADEFDRLLVAPASSTPELTGISTNFYRLHPSDHAEGTRMSAFAVQTLEIERLGMLQADTAYARGIGEVFRSDFERQGGEISVMVEFPPHTEDFDAMVEQVLASDPQAVFLSGHGMEIAGMLRAVRQRGYTGQLLTTSAFATPKAMEAAGDDVNGVFFSQTVFDVSSDLEPIKGFVAAYQEKYGEEPDFYSAHGYDAMLVIGEALKEWNGIPGDLWRSLAGIRSFPGVTGSIQFNERGDVQKYPRVYRFQDGEPIDYEKYLEGRQRAIRERMRELAEQRREVAQ